MSKGTCAHDDQFEIWTKVHRVEHEGGRVTFSLDCHARCKSCGVRFQFAGLPAGMAWDRPMTSVDGFELRAPLEPNAHLTSLVAGDPDCAWPGAKP
jgi:hypothetical protein